MKQILYLSGILLISIYLAGCETIREEGFDHPAPIKEKNPVSGPTKINLSGDIEIDLPEEIRDDFDAPQVSGYYSIKIHSEYIDESKNRSKYSTTLELRVTNLEGTKEYININTESDGEYDGSPNQGIGTAFEQIMETIGIYGKILQQKTKEEQNQSVDTTAVSAPR